MLGLQEYDISGEWKKVQGTCKCKRTVFQCVSWRHLLWCTGQQRYRRQVLPQQRERGVTIDEEEDEIRRRLQHYWAWRRSGSCKSKRKKEGQTLKGQHHQWALQMAGWQKKHFSLQKSEVGLVSVLIKMQLDQQIFKNRKFWIIDDA